MREPARVASQEGIQGADSTVVLDLARTRHPSTRLDSRHHGDVAWTEGNLVRPLIHGAAYFAELHQRVSQMRDGDLLMFAD